MKTNIFLATVFTTWCLAADAISADPKTVSKIDLDKELNSQIASVQKNRNVVSNFNSPSDLAGSVYFCGEADQNSGKYELTGTPYPFIDKKEVSFEGLDTPQLHEWIIKKGGSISGFGASISGDKKHLVHTSVKEYARVTAAPMLNKKQLASVIDFMAAAGMKDDESFCYIWSVSAYRAEISIHDEKKLNVKTPGIFIVTGNASFLQSEKLIDASKFATVVMSKYVFGDAREKSNKATDENVAIAPTAESVSLAAAIEAPSDMDLEQGRATVELVRRIEAVRNLTKDLQISDDAAAKLEQMNEEMILQVTEPNATRAKG